MRTTNVASCNHAQYKLYNTFKNIRDTTACAIKRLSRSFSSKNLHRC